MKDQHWRVAMLSVANGGLTVVDCHVGLKFAHIALQKSGRDVGRGGHSEEVSYAGTDHGRFEAVGVRDSPGCHEATKAPTAYGKALGIAYALRNEVVDSGHDVRKIATAPVLVI